MYTSKNAPNPPLEDWYGKRKQVSWLDDHLTLTTSRISYTVLNVISSHLTVAGLHRIFTDFPII
ncbi:hypothetical protein KSI01_18060 [Kurthia sibirica]|nr:hypothetical protein KSI01_18060 [Kurthia sibirica]